MVSVFISSTGYDLKDYRNVAIEVCNRLRMIPIAMEFFEAMSVGATVGSKRRLAEANLFVGIFAHRYGFVEAGYSKSVTQIEFEYAGELGLERLCFMVDPSYPWPTDAIDYKHYEELQDFKSGIDKSLIRSRFTDVNDFKARLIQALVEWRDENRSQPSGSPEAFERNAPAPATAPPFPSLLMGREDDCQNMKKRMGVFGTSDKVATTVIHGWPGVGKTTLIAALAYADDVIATFSDGILWASVGEDPSPFQELISWGHALGTDMSRVHTLEEAMAQIRALLRDRKVLLIIDDVWDKNAASPFMVGGSQCVTVVTTRFLDIARELANTSEEIFLLGTLSNERGYELLQRLAPTVTQKYRDQSRALVTDLEGLPLALRVAGRLLEAESQAGFDVEVSFTALRESHEMLQAVAPDDRFDPRTGTTPTVGLLLKKSTDRLDEHTRDCYALLGVFAPKPATFDMDALKGVWLVDDPRPIARKLVDRGLLEPIPSIGRFWMHSVLVMHAKSLLEE